MIGNRSQNGADRVVSLLPWIHHTRLNFIAPRQFSRQLHKKLSPRVFNENDLFLGMQLIRITLHRSGPRGRQLIISHGAFCIDIT